MPEADAVVGFAGEGSLADVVLRGRKPTGVRDLLELPRRPSETPWAYVKIAEGCDRVRVLCDPVVPRQAAIARRRRSKPRCARSSSRASPRSCSSPQDLAWYGRDAGEPGSLAPLLRRLDALGEHGLARIRLLYLYPSEVRDPLVSTMLELPSVVPYFDLSLQHAAPGLLRRMKRWGSGDRFRAIIDHIRGEEPHAAFRSSFIVGFPGETEADHETLLAFLADVRLDWAGFFPFSKEDGTPAANMDGGVTGLLVHERLRECSEVQEPITAAARAALVGETVEVLVDSVGEVGELRGADAAEPGMAQQRAS